MNIGYLFHLIKTLKKSRIIVGAEGIYLKTHEGKTLIDASSGLYLIPWSRKKGN